MKGWKVEAGHTCRRNSGRKTGKVIKMKPNKAVMVLNMGNVVQFGGCEIKQEC
jgi:hypothetical protein